MHSIVTTFRGADIKVEVANFCAAMDTLIDQDDTVIQWLSQLNVNLLLNTLFCKAEGRFKIVCISSVSAISALSNIKDIFITLKCIICAKLLFQKSISCLFKSFKNVEIQECRVDLHDTNTVHVSRFLYLLVSRVLASKVYISTFEIRQVLKNGCLLIKKRSPNLIHV